MSSPSRRRALTLLCLAALALIPRNALGGDPYLRWYTVETPHFRVHYHGGLEHFAQHVATVAEEAHRALMGPLNWHDAQVTHVLLTDDSSGANGSANAQPYNAVRMFATAPDDMSPLNDYDDWGLTLMMHEHVHVLHLENAHGLPAVLNAIFGKVVLPNQAQPRWVIEGLATAFESRNTSGGRLRSSQFDMYLRADVLENKLLELDQFTHSLRRYPGGSIFYLYGSRFLDWIMTTYGPETFGAVATDYGQNIIPWGINRSIRRVTGRTYPELYRGWKASLQRRYQAQRAAIVRRGRREGTRLTRHGFVASYPRFEPACDTPQGPRLVYYRSDGHLEDGLVRVVLAPGHDKLVGEAELVARSRETQHSYDGECGLVFASPAYSARRYRFFDLMRQAPGTTSPRGYESGRQRLTTGRRARAPDISPDGRRIVYVTNASGTTTLRLADYDSETGPSRERLLVNKRRYEQVFTPRFSPDGKRVAFGTWLTGGYRDIHIVDVATGKVFAVTHDRALDQQPVWSPDGQTLYFTSDRTGVANIYAYSMPTGQLRQVTNVVTGAYMPAISPDGKSLVYVGYTASGFDLFAMPLNESAFLPVLPYIDSRPQAASLQQVHEWPVSSYSPWPTLRPHNYELDYEEGPFGNQLVFTTEGQDMTGRHSLNFNLAVDFQEYQPQTGLDYWYSGLPVDLRVSAFRSVVPRDYLIGDETAPIREAITGLSSGVGFWVPNEFDSHYLALSYALNRFEQRVPVAKYVDPYLPLPREPHEGQLGLLHLGYDYTNVAGSTYGVSLERGFSMNLGLDYASEATASDDTLVSLNGRARSYIELPWLRHHVLAMALGGGTATGSYPRQGFFSLGGFQDLPLLDAYTSNVLQSGFKLRGYQPSQFRGRQYVLMNTEYRFPIAYVERGPGTLPVFFDSLSGNVFADYGGAFNRFDYEDRQNSLHLGVGAELWIDLVLGYSVSNTLRLGVARGLGPFNQGLMRYFEASARF